MDPYDNNVTLVPEPQPRISRKTIFIGIGVGIALLISVILLLVTSQGNDLQPLEQRLAIRMSNLQTLSTSAQQNISNEDLSSLNSQFSALLISNNTALQTDLSALGVSAKYPKNMVASESDASILSNLNQASVDGNFDQQYINAITKKIDDTATLINTIYAKSKDTKLRQDLAKSYKDLVFIKKQMLKLKLS